MDIHDNRPAGPEVEAQVARARQFLRDIRDAVARHPVASKRSDIRLHERREPARSVLRLSGAVDGVPVELHVHVPDDDPLQPRFEYSRHFERLRLGTLGGVGAVAFAAAHDHACRTHYPDSEPWQQIVDMALEQSYVALARGRLH